MNATFTLPNLVDAHVLLVEDDPDVATVLLELLRMFGCRPIHTRSIDAAREAIGNTRRGFDAAVIDLSLPDGSGAALAGMLHASPLPCAVLLVTGLPGAIATGLALAAEAHDLLCKPIRAHDFAQRLSSTVCGTTRLRRGQPVRDLMLADFGEPGNLARSPDNVEDAERHDEDSRGFYEACHQFLARHQLTPAQARVLPALVAGYDDEIIAGLIDNPVSTVRCHARDILHRLKLRDRTELSELFYRGRTYAGTGPWPSRSTSISSSKNRSTVEGSGHR